ncbi:Transcriptional regulatory protein YehT [compost metagenome]
MKQFFSCMIIDDEPMAHAVLKSHLSKVSELKLEGLFYNIPEAMQYLENHRVDLIFLDIKLPEINGMEFLRNMEYSPKTILTTAYSEYAVESYEHGVIDYLLKPISYERFEKSISRFLSSFTTEEIYHPKEIEINVDSKPIILLETDILYVQSFGNYVRVYTKNRLYLATSTTQDILSDLSPQIFIRVHKSYIVNLSRITNISDKHIIVEENVIPLGITYRRDFLNRINS